MPVYNDFERAVWVSYAGADHESVVQPLVDVTKARYSLNNELEKDCIPFKLITYIRSVDEKSTPLTKDDVKASSKEGGSNNVEKEDESEEVEYEYYLTPGQSISELVRNIALNLRRVFILSDNYIKSDYCLSEFCAALFSHTNKMLIINVPPFKLKDEIKKECFIKKLSDIYEKEIKTKFGVDFLVSGELNVTAYIKNHCCPIVRQ